VFLALPSGQRSEDDETDYVPAAPGFYFIVGCALFWLRKNSRKTGHDLRLRRGMVLFRALYL